MKKMLNLGDLRGGVIQIKAGGEAEIEPGTTVL